MRSSRVASALRLWNGATPAKRYKPAPRPHLTLYEYEASPWCRRVRETLCILGLEVNVRPCPRSTLRVEGAYSSTSVHKPEAISAGGRLLFPFLVDHTAGVALNQSAAIVEHLWAAYGVDVVERPSVDRWLNGCSALDLERPVLEASLLPKLVDFVLLATPSLLRPWPDCGLFEAPVCKRPERPLVLHACEPEPSCRFVREKLCALQLPYRHVPRPAASPLPHLEDPNTGWASFGAPQALEYLAAEYEAGPPMALGVLFAPVPEPNLGEARRSWFSGVFDAMAPVARR